METWINIIKYSTPELRELYNYSTEGNADGIEVKLINESDIILKNGITSEFKNKNIDGLIWKDFIDDKTINLLKLCVEYYQYIGVRTLTPHHENRNSKPYLYPHDEHFVKHSLFGEPWEIVEYENSDREYKREGRNKGWPFVWGVIEKVGGRKFCGNSHQSQISNKDFTTGLYKTDGKEWFIKK